MRALACLLALALAGCSSATDTDAPSADITDSVPAPAEVPTTSPEVVAAAPFHLDRNGTLWLPPSSGPDPVESRVPFEVNASASLHVTLHLASTLTPVATAHAVVELRDPTGAVLATASFEPPGLEPNTKELDAEATVAGPYELRFETYGGSDGSGNGDHIDYRIVADGAAAA
jgi:hypothetical protein